MVNTTNVRTTILARDMANHMMASINKARAKKKLPPLSQSQVIALAIENLTVEQGVSR